MKIHHLTYLGLLPALAVYGAGNGKTGVSQSLNLPKLQDAGKLRNVIFILSDDHRFDYMGFKR